MWSMSVPSLWGTLNESYELPEDVRRVKHHSSESLQMGSVEVYRVVKLAEFISAEGRRLSTSICE